MSAIKRYVDNKMDELTMELLVAKEKHDKMISGLNSKNSYHDKKAFLSAENILKTTVASLYEHVVELANGDQISAHAYTEAYGWDIILENYYSF